MKFPYSPFFCVMILYLPFLIRKNTPQTVIMTNFADAYKH